MIIWILLLYMISVLVSYPFQMLFARKQVSDGYEEEYAPFNIYFIARSVSFIPFYNLYDAYNTFKDWYGLRRAIIKTRQVAQIMEREGQQDEADKLRGMCDELDEYNKLFV